MSNSPEGVQPEQSDSSSPQLPPPAMPTPPPPQWPPAGASIPPVVQTPPGASYAPPAAYQTPYMGTPANPVPQSNGIGIAGLVLALLGITCVVPVVGSILGIIFGHMGMKAADQGRADGRGMAKAGFILGIVGLGLCVVAVLIFVAILVIAAVNGNTHMNVTTNGV